MVKNLPSSVLIVGSGGREHALAKTLALSPAKPRLLCAPGNAGIAAEVTCFPVAMDNIAGLVELAQRERVEFVVVGPEVPLSLGLVDALTKVGIPAEQRVNQLTDAEVLQIRETIDRDYLVEGDLRREVITNIKRLMDLGCYRGLRHRKGLPVRGQRTHTNARTRKGKAKPIAGKKK